MQPERRKESLRFPAALAFRREPEGNRVPFRPDTGGKAEDLGGALRRELYRRTDGRADDIRARLRKTGVSRDRKSDELPRPGHKPCPDHGNQPLIASILTWVYGCMWPILRFSFFLDL